MYSSTLLTIFTLTLTKFTLAIPLPFPQTLSPSNPTAVNIIMTSNDTLSSEYAVSIPIDSQWHCLASQICYTYSPNDTHPFNLAFPFSGPDSLCATANVSTVVNGGGADCTIHVPKADANMQYVELQLKDDPYNYTVANPLARVCCGDCPVPQSDVPTEILGNGTEVVCGTVLVRRSISLKDMLFGWI